MTAKTYLALGTNLGERITHLRSAFDSLAHWGKVTARSSVYESAPMYVVDQPAFLNMCASFETALTPSGLLRRLKEIERDFGRDPKGLRNGPRVIDLDILFYGDLVLDTSDLIIPHPRIAERAFVLTPLAEIAPDLLHPTLRATIAELDARIEDQGLRRIGPL